MARIYVVLATYNGEKYLSKMLDSLMAQSRPADKIIAVDDGSKDRTPEILKSYQDALPLQITCLEKNSGHRAAFSRALEIAQPQLADDDLIALADQDDVWLPQKLDQLEKAIATTKASLAFGDAEVINGDGQIIAPSWQKFSGIEKRVSILQQIAGINNVTGCTSIFKASLLSSVLPIPEGVTVHDRWIAIIAEKNDGIATIDMPVIQYRIHGENAVGGATEKSMRKTIEERIRWVGTLLVHKERIRLTDEETRFAVELKAQAEERLHKKIMLSKLLWNFAHRKELFLKDSPVRTFKRVLFSVIGLPLASRLFGKN